MTSIFCWREIVTSQILVNKSFPIFVNPWNMAASMRLWQRFTGISNLSYYTYLVSTVMGPNLHLDLLCWSLFTLTIVPTLLPKNIILNCLRAPNHICPNTGVLGRNQFEIVIYMIKFCSFALGNSWIPFLIICGYKC